jgi:hypothetical protein
MPSRQAWARSNTCRSSQGFLRNPIAAIQVHDTSSAMVINTGEIECTIPKSGNAVIASLKHGGKIIATQGRLIGSRCSDPEKTKDKEPFEGVIASVTLEQQGPIRCVVKIEGTHVTPEGRKWLPFCLRIRFYAGSACAQMTHTFVFDGDEYRDFISSLGVQFEVAMPMSFTTATCVLSTDAAVSGEKRSGESLD